MKPVKNISLPYEDLGLIKDCISKGNQRVILCSCGMSCYYPPEMTAEEVYKVHRAIFHQWEKQCSN